jgi:hypothetical protein
MRHPQFFRNVGRTFDDSKTCRLQTITAVVDPSILRESAGRYTPKSYWVYYRNLPSPLTRS